LKRDQILRRQLYLLMEERFLKAMWRCMYILPIGKNMVIIEMIDIKM